MSESTAIAIREIIFVSTNLALLLIVMDQIFKRKRSIAIPICFCVSKLLIINVFFHFFLQEEMQTNEFVQAACVLISSAISLSAYFVFWYTYQADLVKIMVVGMLGDATATCMGYVYNICINLISGRSLFEIETPVQPADALFPVLLILTTPGLCKCLRWIRVRVQNWKVKHKRSLLSLIGSFLVAGVYTNILGLEKSTIISYLCIVIMVIFFFVFYIRVYYRKVAKEKEYLKKQQKFSKMKYSAITIQIEQMERAQKEINEQMKKIMEISESTDGRTQLLERYVKGLKMQSSAIMHGMFCDSWLLDSVLSYQMLKCQERNISADFQLYGYQKGMIREVDLAELMHYLLEIFIEATDVNTVVFKMASIKGQLIIQIIGDGKDIRVSKRKMQRFVRGYQMVINKRKMYEKTELKITMDTV